MNNPFWVQDVGTFTVETYVYVDGALKAIDTGTFSGVYEPIAGVISENLSVTTSDEATYAEDVQYTVAFTPKHFVPQRAVV